MVESRDVPPEPKRQHRPTPEEVWIRGFLEFSGTDNVTRYCRADLRGVSLTRVIEAIFLGEMIRSNKCDGAGAVCLFHHESDCDAVDVEVFFVAGEMKLEIRGALTVEVQGEPNAA
jgi:hypothetical protein